MQLGSRSGKSFINVSKASLMVLNFSRSFVRNSSMAFRDPMALMALMAVESPPWKTVARPGGICLLLLQVGLLEESRASRDANLD